MLDKKNLLKISVFFLPVILLSHPTLAHAWDWDRSHHQSYDRHSYYHVHHPYPTYGQAVFALPHGYISIGVGGQRYHYCDGIFYRHIDREYVVVAPPVGAIIDTRPSDCRTVIINGETYYENNGVYYRLTSNGYEVVGQPRVTVIEPARIAAQTQIQNTDEVFIVNILNSQGGYTAVTLKKSGNGFIGPQGEFYPEFPKVEQLRVMYAK